MTREEAITRIQDHRKVVLSPFEEKTEEAFDLAIEALQESQTTHDQMDACYMAQKQVTGKLNSPCDSLLTADSGECKEQKSKLDTDLISRQAAGKTFCALCNGKRFGECEYSNTCQSLRALQSVPSAEPVNKDAISREGLLKSWNELSIRGRTEFDQVIMTIPALPSAEPEGDMGEVSDGYHTFNQLYHQRAVLFATIVNQNKNKAWKSWKHDDGECCFDSDGEWFIVGVDTPQGSYTYHYAKEYWDMFECEELCVGKHWDGHTEDDVKRLLSLPPSAEPVQPHQVDCTGCKFVGTYDTDFPCANCLRKTKDFYCGAKME